MKRNYCRIHPNGTSGCTAPLESECRYFEGNVIDGKVSEKECINKCFAFGECVSNVARREQKMRLEYKKREKVMGKKNFCEIMTSCEEITVYRCIVERVMKFRKCDFSRFSIIHNVCDFWSGGKCCNENVQKEAR